MRFNDLTFYFRKSVFNAFLRFVLMLSIAFNGFLSAYAQSVVIDAGAASANQAGLDAAGNGVPIINIVTPNGAGVSHNKFSNYNVDRQGLILNNGKVLGSSQLGGLIQGNPNLRNSPNASLIINEVTSTNPTALNGFTEVYGQAADLVIANPNGITVNGGGFINVPRATLTTGVPQFSVTGALTGISVDKGAIAIEALGLDATQSSVLDIVTRSVQLNGYIHGKDVGLFLGPQDFDYVTRTTTGKAGDAATKPAFALDSTALGGISADTIRIVGTELGVGVRAPEQMAASSGDLTLTADGQIVLKSATARKKIIVSSTASSVRVEGSLNAQEAIEISAADSAIFADNSTSSSAQDVNVSAANIELQQQANVSAGIDESGEFVDDVGLLTLAATQSITIAQDSVARGGAGATINAQTSFDNNGGSVRSDQVVSITSPTINNAGSVLGRDIVFDSATLLSNTSDGLVRASNDLTFAQRTATIDNEGVFSAGNQASIDATNLNNKAGSEIVSNNVLLIKAASLTNDGVISSENGLTAEIDTKLTNNLAGSIQSLSGPLSINAPEIENAGLIGSGGTLAANVDTFKNNAGTFISLQDLIIEGQTTGTRATLVMNDQGAIESLDGDILIRAETLENFGKADITTVTTEVEHQFSQSPPPSWVLSLPASFYRALISDAGFAQLSDGGRTQTYVFVPHPDKLDQILAASGQTIDQFTATDWQAHAPTNQSEFNPDEWVIFVPDEAQHAPSGSDVIVTTETDVLDGPIKQATIAAGQGNITLDTVNFTNRVGTVSSAGDLLVDAVNIVNEGFELNRSVSVRLNYGNDTVRSMGWAGWFGAGNNGPNLVERDNIGNAPATISAVGNLTGTASGSIINAATPATLPSSLSFANTSDTLVFTGRGGDTSTGIGFNPSLFTPAPEDSLYVIETRADFIDPSLFFGSEYFLQRLGYSPEGTLRLLGDAYFDTRLIMQAILDKTGNRYLDEDVASDQDQLKRLIENGVAAARDLQLVVGVVLTEEQQAALTEDIVWLVEVEVNGEIALVPQLFLSKKKLDQITATAARMAAGGDLTLSAANALINDGGSFQAGNDANFVATQLEDRGGRYNAGNFMGITADSAKFDVMLFGTGDAQRTKGIVVERTPTITAKDLQIDTKDLVFVGGTITVPGHAIINTERVAITPKLLETLTKYKGQSSEGEVSSQTYILPSIDVGDFTINASEAALIQAAKINVDKNLTIRAGELLITSVADEDRSNAKLSKTGFKKGTNTFDRITITQIPTIINVGGDIHLEATVGNAIIKASVINSGGEATVKAAKQVEFLTAYDLEYERETKTGQSVVWQSASDEGSETRTVVHTQINAGSGLNVEAKEGIVIEFRKGLKFDEGIESLSKLEGLEWMADLRERDDIDWKEVEETYNSWSEKQEGLSGPAALIITLAIAVATQGAGAGLAGQLGISSAVGTNMVVAGFGALSGTAGVSLLSNKGDFGDVFKELTSKEFAQSFAIAILSAGLTTGALNLANIGGISAEASASQNFAKAVQRNLVRATIKAGVQSTVTGRPLDDALVSALRFAAADALGSSVAVEIGKAYHSGQIGKASQIIAHAALGCATGAIGSGDCTGGATGGVTGELAAELYVKSWTDSVLTRARNGRLTPEEFAIEIASLDGKAIDIASLTGGLIAALVGGDVNAGASAGGNAAENNLLCAGLCISGVILAASAIYATAVGSGDPLDGLEQIGAGTDPLAETIASGVNATINMSMEAYPDQTLAVLGVLEAIGEASGIVVGYVDNATGELVSENWNNLPKSTRNLIKGGTIVATFVIPPASVAKLRALQVAKTTGGVGGKGIAVVAGQTCVYSCVVGGTTRYVGITNDIARRGLEHLREKGIKIGEIRGLSNLSIADARAVEQTLIHHYGLVKDGGSLQNIINSISPTRNPTAYESSLVRGKELLDGIGYQWTN